MENFITLIKDRLDRIRDVLKSNAEEIFAKAQNSGVNINASTFSQQFANEDDYRQWFKPVCWRIEIFDGLVPRRIDLLTICFKAELPNSAKNRARHIQNQLASITSFLNEDAHVHVTRPAACFSLSAAIKAMLENLNFESDNDLQRELDEGLRTLFSSETAFLQRLFDTEEDETPLDSLTNPSLDPDDEKPGAEPDPEVRQKFEQLAKIWLKFKKDIEGMSISDKKMHEIALGWINDNNEDLPFFGTLNWENKEVLTDLESELGNGLSHVINLDPDWKMMLASLGELEVADFSKHTHQFLTRRVMENIAERRLFYTEPQEVEGENILETAQLDWSEVRIELLALRNKIRWSTHKPENWENILMAPIVERMGAMNIKSKEEWLSDSFIKQRYERSEEVTEMMDRLLEEFWPDIQVLLD